MCSSTIRSFLVILCLVRLAAGGGSARAGDATGATGDSLDERLLDLQVRHLERPSACTDPDSLDLCRRDYLLRVARDGSSLATELDLRAAGSDLPDRRSRDAKAVAIQAYGEALGLHAKILDPASRAVSERTGSKGAAVSDSTPFVTLWDSAVSDLLAYLRRWPALWQMDLETQGVEIYLPLHLLSLCTCEAFKGDAYALPREQLDRRMAELADSIAAFCMDNDKCRALGGMDCPAYAAALVARCTDLDALVGFRFAARYWALPPGSPPRSPSNDRFVASATIGFLEELRSSVKSARLRPGDRGDITEEVALEILRREGGIWPGSLDPFRSVPGLRNPRWTSEGQLTCDLAIFRECHEAADEKASDWLLGRLLPGEKLLLIELP